MGPIPTSTADPDAEDFREDVKTQVIETRRARIAKT